MILLTDYTEIKVMKRIHKKLYGIICIALCALLALPMAACGGAIGGSGGGSGGTGGGASGGNGADGADASGGAGADAKAGADAAATAASANAAAPAFDDGGIAGALTVSAFETMRFEATLNAAAEAFIEKYPDLDITVETFSSMPEIKRQESADGRSTMIAAIRQDNPQERTDYLNKVNTALMSGEGADVLAMDILPVAKYVESGLLENLAPYMDADPGFDITQYRKNILDAVTWKGGTWFIPMDYNFNYYTYDSTLVGGDAASFGADAAFMLEQLIAIGAPLYDGETKLLNTPEYTGGPSGSAWSRLLRERWPEFVDIANKKAHFTDGGFVELLAKVREYGEKGYLPPGFTGRMDADAMMRQAGQAPTDRIFFKSKDNMQLLAYFMRGSVARFSVSFGGAAAIEDDDEIAGIAANADNSVPFTYTQAYAINSNSKNKRAAWEFIKFLMGGEMQASGATGMFRGLPLHNETRAHQIENMMAAMAAGNRGGGAFGVAGFGRVTDDRPEGAGGRNRQGGSGGSGGSGEPAVKGGGADAGETAAKDGDVNKDGSEAKEGPGGSGEPVVKGGDADAGESAVKGGDTPLQPGGREGLPEIDPEVLKKYYEATERLSDLINTYEIKDSTVDDMIASEVQYFFDGTKTAEEVAKTLQNKVEMYLNE